MPNTQIPKLMPSIPSSIKVGLVQPSCTDDPEVNLAKVCSMTAEAAQNGAHVVVHPELFSHRYFCQVEDHQFFSLSEPVPGPTTNIMCDLAKSLNTVIVTSIYEKSGSKYFNTAVIIDSDGSVKGIYRKMHIPYEHLYYEKFYFAEGDLGFKAIETSVGKIGILVCWDQWFPEAARMTALLGADLIVIPTAIGASVEDMGPAAVDRNAWETVQRGHSVANNLPVLCVNRVGFEPSGTGGLDFWGGSFGTNCQGQIIAKAPSSEESIVYVTVNPEIKDKMRKTWPFFRDRRTDSYADLCK